MTGRAALLPGALAYHLHARRVPLMLLAVMASLGTGGLLVLTPPDAGLADPVVPLAVAVLGVPMVVMQGAVRGEVRSGRAALFRLAAGGACRWLPWDLALRLVVVLAATAATLGGTAGAACAAGSLTQAADLLRASPFFIAAALTFGAVAYGCSALATRLDSLLAGLYLVPGSIVGVSLASAGGPPRSLVWLALPVDALLTLAPGAPQASHGDMAAAVLHLVGFTATWLLVGLGLGCLQSAGHGEA